MMLLIDGVKYKLWTPQSEDEFERIVKEHAQDIFGKESIYSNIKPRLISELGTGSIPDGFVVFWGDSPNWRIVEVELSTHPLHDHIVSQVGRFISGIGNMTTQRKIVDAMDSELYKNEFIRLKLKKTIGSIEVYKFLSDLISKQPILTVIIEKETPALKEALKILNYPHIDVVEFQTFIREGVGLAVHAHLFEPLYEAKPSSPPLLPPPPGDRVEITLQQDNVRACYIDIPKAKKVLFPDSKTTLDLETGIGLMEIGFNPASWGTRLQGGLPKWFKAHPELKVGDKVRITVIEPMKKYRLEIVK